jgi:hypothetical protein
MDRGGNVIVAGTEFGLGASYIAKYGAADGALLGKRRSNEPANSAQKPPSVAVDSNGNVVITGYSQSGFPYNSDYYTAKYAATNGALLWQQRYNGPANTNDYANALVIDANGNAIVTGSSVGAGTANDYYTVKYAATVGFPIWTRRYNGPANGNDEVMRRCGQ